MKGVFLVGAAVFAASCSHDSWYQTTDAAQQAAEEYSTNFKNIVLGGQDVDSRQTWNTGVSTEITLISAKTGTLKIYATDPAQGTAVAALYTGYINKNEVKTFVVARPQNASVLYATIYDSNNYMIDNMAFDASASKVTVAFYTTPAGARQARAPRRAIQPIFNFPSDCDASKFLSDVPSGVAKLTQNAAMVNNYIDETWQGELNIWGGWDGSKTSGGTLYIKGTHYFIDRKFYIAPNTDVYLLEGAVLVLGYYNGKNNASDLQGGCNYYLAPGAKIATPDDVEMVLNNGLHIYNHGTIDVSKLSVNNTSVLYRQRIIILSSSTMVLLRQPVCIRLAVVMC